MIHAARLALSALTALCLLAACSSASAGGGDRSSATSNVTVFAASSLTDVFAAEATAYQAKSGNGVTFSFAGSQDLVAQIGNGAPADVLATADEKTMGLVADRLADPPRVFAHNTLVIALAKDNPGRVHTLADLGRDGVVVVLPDPSVPAGKYAAQALSDAHVSVKPASLEDNVRSVLTKVRLGEADAGIVYRTDVRATGGGVTSTPIDGGPVATYPIAPVDPAGRGFVDFVLSPAGLAILAKFGFLPP